MENSSTADETQIPDERSRKPPRKISVWLIWLAGLVCALLILLVLSAPEIQKQRYINQLRSRGVVVGTTTGSGWRTTLADQIFEYTGTSLPLELEVYELAFDSVPLTEKTLPSIKNWKQIQRLELQNINVNEKQLQQFVDQHSNLTNLTIVNCNGISSRFVQDLQNRSPGINIFFRGRVFLGIDGYDYYRTTQGCYVYFVRRNSAADLGGMLAGDVILEFDGEQVLDFHHLTLLIGRKSAGDKVEILVRRDFEQFYLTCQLQEWN